MWLQDASSDTLSMSLHVTLGPFVSCVSRGATSFSRTRAVLVCLHVVWSTFTQTRIVVTHRVGWWVDRHAMVSLGGLITHWGPRGGPWCAVACDDDCEHFGFTNVDESPWEPIDRISAEGFPPPRPLQLARGVIQDELPPHRTACFLLTPQHRCWEHCQLGWFQLVGLVPNSLASRLPGSELCQQGCSCAMRGPQIQMAQRATLHVARKKEKADTHTHIKKKARCPTFRGLWRSYMKHPPGKKKGVMATRTNK